MSDTGVVERAIPEQDVKAVLERVRRLASLSLGSIGDIRRGSNVPSKDVWSACEYLDDLLALVNTEISKVGS